MSTAVQAYPIGTAGQPWGEEERAAWLAQAVIKRSYKDEVLVKLEPLKEEFDVVQYGALPYDTDRYPLFAVKSRNWSPSKPSVLVTGGVHGYETSGVQGALLFLKTKAKEYSKNFNIVVLPCVSPWGYEAIQRWNQNAEDPNRGFQDPTRREECAAAIKLIASLGGPGSFTVHFDLHETTDTDADEFRPAKAARDGVPYVPDGIPDGFYLVGNTEEPQLEWHKHMIEAVRKVTHIAPADDKGNIIGEPVVQEGIILIPAKQLGLCSSLTNAKYATTTEVYPDSPTATDEQCNHAQVACVSSGLDWILAQK